MRNEKGGVGKTMTSINLGAALAEPGRKVLLVDFDRRHPSPSALGIDLHDVETTIYHAMRKCNVEIDEVIVPTSIDGLDLVPSKSTSPAPRCS